MPLDLRYEPLADVRPSRLYERHDVDVITTGTMPNSAICALHISNLSAGGFRGEMTHDLMPGARFRIKLVRGEGRHATIVWRQGDSFGCAFDTPIFDLAT